MISGEIPLSVSLEASRLTREWQTALVNKKLLESDYADRAEQNAWDELVDFVEANDLNGTVADPRGEANGR